MPHKKRKTTWIATLDGARARIYEGSVLNGGLALLPDGAFDGSRALTQEIESDRPGHTQESVGSARHAIEPPMDAHRHAEAEFVRKVAAHLRHAAHQHRFDELIVVASPRICGSISATTGRRSAITMRDDNRAG
jgi:protein required for attachment to host cells